VCPREFHVGDLVLRRIQGSKDKQKLSPPWRGHSSSTKYSDLGHTRSSTWTGGSSPTHGTSSTCARFIRELLFKPHTSINRCCMPCSRVLEFRNLSMVVFTSLQQCLGLSSEHPCTNAKTFPARGLPRHDALPPFFTFFHKNPDIRSRPIARAKGFLEGNSILREVRATACVG
jgi:hypothetical protein